MQAIAQEAYSLPPLETLLLWRDPVPRRGAESMAADEALLLWGGASVMRAYRWALPTVTYGFFDHEDVARRIYTGEELYFVRRWTGGGIVDHRHDIPFTLALREQDREGRPTSADLYRWIHGGLARTLKDCLVEAVMLTDDAPDGGRACFSSPVTSDLVLPNGEKLAGGGQRRSRAGVLHQGSIQNCVLPDGWDENLASRLALNVTVSTAEEPFEGFLQKVDELLRTKYDTPEWRQGARRKSGH